MSDKDRNFHEYAVNSILFKGRSDWYFCFLKSERIAQVLWMLDQSGEKDAPPFQDLRIAATRLPATFVQFVAGEASSEAVLAELFSLISMVRLCGRANLIVKGNAIVIEQEYRDLVERFSAGMVRSPFVSSQDFALPDELLALEEKAPFSLPRLDESYVLPRSSTQEPKGLKETSNKGQSERSDRVLDFVLKNKGVSIKEIATAVEGYGIKTIQRELTFLVRQGSIKRVGERRWSLYFPT